MDLAYADKLAIDNNGVKYLLVCQDLLDRTLDAEVMKTKESFQRNSWCFLTMITKKNRPKKVWVDKGADFVGEFENLSKAEGIHNYATNSETKAAFAERTMRS